MGFQLEIKDFNMFLDKISKEYKVFAPKVFDNKGAFSDTDIIRYDEIKNIEEVEFNKKSAFSYKEVVLPITQTLFYFTEDRFIEPKIEEKKPLIILRSCDMHSVKRIDEIYLNNSVEDPYYKKLRENAKFIVMGCEKSFENCFCVSMGTNKTEDGNGYIKVEKDKVSFQIDDEYLQNILKEMKATKKEVKVNFAYNNSVKVNIPKNIDVSVMDSPMWKEYSKRCISCGRCNFVCPTCTCNTMQDIFYKDNEKNGERRRVWASCQVDGYTEMAGGHGFRNDAGQRMRFKVMHKVYDFKKRTGYHMCVGCGRCDDICPEYISFSNCVNKLEDAMKKDSDIPIKSIENKIEEVK